MSNLLIGNGLNLTNNKNLFLKSEKIYKRFLKNLEEYILIISELFGLENFDYESIKKVLTEKDGIETLAGNVFSYIYNEIEKIRKFSWNDCYRLIELLGEISIKSIFFDKEFKIPEVDNKYIVKISKSYEEVFTLNYIETWNIDKKVKYLHGDLEKYISEYCDICSLQLSYNNIYKSIKKGICKKINFKDIIFIPCNSLVDKFDYIGEGLIPKKCGLESYPAEDLFPYKGNKLYNEIETLDNLDIFGVSPYGDQALINSIKKIKEIKIYIHNLNEDEIKSWKENGLINVSFVDSKDFLNM